VLVADALDVVLTITVHQQGWAFKRFHRANIRAESLF
jgi:hypothetical protein